MEQIDSHWITTRTVWTTLDLCNLSLLFTCSNRKSKGQKACLLIDTKHASFSSLLPPFFPSITPQLKTRVFIRPWQFIHNLLLIIFKKVINYPLLSSFLSLYLFLSTSDADAAAVFFFRRTDVSVTNIIEEESFNADCWSK